MGIRWTSTELMNRNAIYRDQEAEAMTHTCRFDKMAQDLIK